MQNAAGNGEGQRDDFFFGLMTEARAQSGKLFDGAGQALISGVELRADFAPRGGLAFLKTLAKRGLLGGIGGCRGWPAARYQASRCGGAVPIDGLGIEPAAMQLRRHTVRLPFPSS